MIEYIFERNAHRDGKRACRKCAYFKRSDCPWDDVQPDDWCDAFNEATTRPEGELDDALRFNGTADRERETNKAHEMTKGENDSARKSTRNQQKREGSQSF